MKKKLQHKLTKSSMIFIAYCGLVRACRGQYNLHHGFPAVVGVVLPEGADVEVYEKAAYYMVSSETARLFDIGDDRTAVITRKGKAASWQLNDELLTQAVRDKSQVIVLAENLEALPRDFSIVADDIVHVAGPTRGHISAACRLCLKLEATESQVEFISSMPSSVIGTALRRGRSIAASIERMKLAIVPKKEPAKDVLEPTLKDLHGLGEAGQWGRELAIDLADWQAGRIPWSDVDRGILLSGPPGTGKTTFAAALARTCDVYLALGSIARWQAKGHLGDLLKAMRKTFDDAKARAPSIVFLDEIDAIGDRERFSGHNRQYATEVVSALLECLDGAEGREGVVVVGACNHPKLIDAALTRAGRFDRHVRIPLPDHDGRRGILRWHLRGQLEDGDLEQVCRRTEGWSGASLEKLVRDARRFARRSKRPMSVDDLIGALPVLVPVPTAVRRRAAIHEAGHAVVGVCLQVGALQKVSILGAYDPAVSGIHQGGGAIFKGEQIQERLESQYLDDIAVTLAGLASEEVLLGMRSGGGGGEPGSDLCLATVGAIRMETSYGLGRSLVFRCADDAQELLATMRQDADLRGAIEEKLSVQFARAKSIVQHNRSLIERMADCLVERGEMSGRDVQVLLGEGLIDPSKK